MGAWSTKIFDNDTAADILDEYKILLGYGIEPKVVYEKISSYFGKDFIGADDRDDYWLAIAYFQWKNGMLEMEVKENALRCLSDKRYLERWKVSGKAVYEKRKIILKEFQEKLLYEKNPIKKKFSKCPKYLREKTNYKVGDLLCYQNRFNSTGLVDGKNVLLRVINISQSSVSMIMPELDYSSNAEVMLYNWYGDDVPSIKQIDKFDFIPFKLCSRTLNSYDIVSNVCIVRMKGDEENGHIKILGNDERFEYCKPELYLQNPGSPATDLMQLNIMLSQTFTKEKNKEAVWHYKA